MADEHAPENPSPDSSDDPNLAAASEEELDAVLAEAASLATELSREVGTADEPAAPADARNTPERPQARSSNLDAELANLEGLVAAASTEVGPTAREPDASKARADAADKSIPDFMKEFTSPDMPADVTSNGEGAATSEPPAPAPPPGAPAADAAGTTKLDPTGRPGVVGTGMLGIVSNVDEAPTIPAWAVLDEPQGNSGEAAEPPADALQGKLIHLAISRLSPAAWEFSRRGVTLLEWLDRPFGWAGENTRRVIGWIALATVGTSIIVYLTGLF